MQDWKQILSNIYSPEVGSIWVAPNSIWKVPKDNAENTFAHNKTGNGFHPAVVGKLNSDSKSCQIIPGTTKEYQRGSCVFKIKITSDIECPNSYFLIKLWMSYSFKDLQKLHRGWRGVDSLNNTQTKELRLQIKFCYGIDV